MADGRDAPHATFVRPDLGSFCRLDELGLQVVGQRIEPRRALLTCRVVETDEFARWCRRYRCTGCGHVWRQDTSRAGEPRAKLSRRARRWALEGIVCQHLTVARVAEGLGVSWNTANDAVLAEGRRVLIEDPHRFDGVRVIGVDEHCWRHTPASSCSNRRMYAREIGCGAFRLPSCCGHVVSVCRPAHTLEG